jgi:hypothetical protein
VVVVVVVVHQPVMHLAVMDPVVMRPMVMHRVVVHSMMRRMRRGHADGERQDECRGERRCHDFQDFSPTFGCLPNHTGSEA